MCLFLKKVIEQEGKEKKDTYEKVIIGNMVFILKAMNVINAVLSKVLMEDEINWKRKEKLKKEKEKEKEKKKKKYEKVCFLSSDIS